MNIATPIKYRATYNKDKMAVIFEDKKFTYEELNDRINRLANALLAKGITKGKRVAYWMENCNEIVETYFAIAKTGAAMVPLSTAYTPASARDVINNSEAEVLIFQDIFAEAVKEMIPTMPSIKNLIFIGTKPDLNAEEYESVLASSSGREPAVEVGMDDILGLIPTGGSTGLPKLIVLPHGRQVWVSIGSILALGLRDDDVYLNALPLFHGAGQTQAMNNTLFMGGTIVILRRARPEMELQTIEKYRCTCAMNMPPAFITWLRQVPDARKYDVSSIRIYYLAGGPMSLKLRKDVFDFFPNATLYYIWGYGEMGPDGSALRVQRENPAWKDGSCGVPLMDADWQIVDWEDRPVPVGVEGEIGLKGPHMAKEYYKNKKETEATFRKGWVYSGDIMKADEDGYLYFVDRKKDMIKSGGLNVYANEVEGMILSHPKVSDAAVIGVPDPKWGEAVKGIVVLKEGERATADEIISYCKEKLERFKVPKSIDFITSMPRNPSGKIMKYELRQQYTPK